MRPLAALFAAFALFSSPAGAANPYPAGGCPPLTVEQALRKAEFALRPAPGMAQAIGLSGWPAYCNDGPLAKRPLLCRGGKGGRLSLEEVKAVDAAYRSQFTYQADYITYGDEDRWRAGVVCGDCEDYSLTLAERLNKAGQGGKFMRLVLWGPKYGGGHATLMVETSDAGVVEIGNGPAETESAQPYDPTRGTRFATIRFDGKRRIEPMPGYTLTRDPAVVPAK